MVILSFSERVAPRVYTFGFATIGFVTEPLYWRTLRAHRFHVDPFVTVLTLVLAFPSRSTSRGWHGVG